jgi:hypothetical protein
MAGMLQILTYLLSFYLVIKGVEILQIALASGRPKRTGIIILGALALAACLVAAIGFSYMQDRQAMPTAEAPLRSSDDSGYVMFTCIPRDGPCFDWIKRTGETTGAAPQVPTSLEECTSSLTRKFGRPDENGHFHLRDQADDGSTYFECDKQ